MTWISAPTSDAMHRLPMKPKLLTTLQTYDRHQFGSDLVAGLTVAMVALPLSIAIAVASGAAPEKGLITAIVGGVLISLLGGSRVQIGGPTGAFIVVVFGVIAEHGYDGLIVATFMAGVIMLVAGLLRAGNLVAHVPEPVVNGFTIGIAIIIATSQLEDLFGLTIAQVPAEFVGKLDALWAGRDGVSGPALAVGLATMLLIVLLRRRAPKFPGLIVAVGLTSAVVALPSISVDTLYSRFGALPGTLPVPAMPDLSLARIVELLPSALVIAFLASIESLLSAMVADRMIGGHHRPNAEILAQGFANIGSALFGGDRAFLGHSPRHAGRSTPYGIPGDARFGRFADPDCLEHERAAQVERVHEGTAVRSDPTVADDDPDRVRRSHRCHRRRGSPRPRAPSAAAEHPALRLVDARSIRAAASCGQGGNIGAM